MCVCVHRGGSSVCVMTWWKGQRKSERENRKRKQERGKNTEWRESRERKEEGEEKKEWERRRGRRGK